MSDVVMATDALIPEYLVGARCLRYESNCLIWLSHCKFRPATVEKCSEQKALESGKSVRYVHNIDISKGGAITIN